MARLRVVIINPVTPELSTTPSLGAAYVAGAIDRAGHEVSIIDANSRLGGYTPDRLYREVQGLKPDVIGFSFCTGYIPLIYQQMQMLKGLAGLTIAGGPHPTSLPDEALRNGADIVIRGEGEDTIVDLLKAWKLSNNLEEVYGISFKRGQDYIHNPGRPLIDNLDNLQPARDFIRYESYYPKKSQRLFENILTSRGCPCKCIFCSSLAMGRERVRVRSAENVVNEILELNSKYNFRIIRISDDTFTWHRVRTEEICRMLIDRAGGRIRWSCVTRANKVDSELLHLMKKAGCFQITFGLESFIPETLKRIKKGILIDQALAVANSAMQVGMNTRINLIHGWPWERLKDVDHTISSLKKLIGQGIRCNTKGMLVPYPGTEIYETFHREYGFTDWWLKQECNNNAIWQRPWFQSSGINSYYHDPMVKKDFFKYTPSIKLKYRELFELEESGYRGGKKIGFWRNLSKYALYLLSRALFFISPAVERIIIQAIQKILRGCSYSLELLSCLCHPV